MADISILSRLVSGYQRNVDVSQNSLVVGSLKVGTSSPTELTKTILDKLILVYNMADADGTYDSRYFTETELSDATGPATGSDLIGDDNTYSNFTPSAATVKGALEGIDSALAATADEKVKISATDTTAGYLAAKIQVDIGSNTTNALEESILNPAGDETFRIRFDQSKVDHGSITGLGDDDHTIYTKADGTRAFTGNQSFGGFKATNLSDPSSAQDAVTLAYMNARLNGLTPKAPVRAATLVAGTLASSFENGDVIDGITLATGNRILIKNQAAPEENGIYVVQASGAPVRATDMDSLTPIDEFNGAWTTIQEGTQAGQVFVQYGTVAIVGTDPINFAYYNPIAGLIGGDMITFSGSTFSVDLATNGGLKSSNPGNVAGQLQVSLEASNPSLQINGSNELKVKLDAAGAIASGASGIATQVDNSTIEINTNALRVKDAGITLAKLASNSVDENKIVSTSFNAAGAVTGGGGSKIAVQVDGSSIEINTNALRVKSTAYDQATITGGSGSAAAVQYSPKVQNSEVAGEALAATSIFALRYAKAADAGFVAGRMYKATNDSSVTDNFEVIGLVNSGAGASAGDTISVVSYGPFTFTSHGFTVGQPVFLSTGGALTGTAPSGVGTAVVRVGMVKDANTIFVMPQIIQAS